MKTDKNRSSSSGKSSQKSESKSPAKKTASKKAAPKKSAGKKSSAKKAAPKKAAPKKAAPKKAAPKKAAPKKAAPKKAASKKSAPKKSASRSVMETSAKTAPKNIRKSASGREGVKKPPTGLSVKKVSSDKDKGMVQPLPPRRSEPPTPRIRPTIPLATNNKHGERMNDDLNKEESNDEDIQPVDESTKNRISEEDNSNDEGNKGVENKDTEEVTNIETLPDEEEEEI